MTANIEEHASGLLEWLYAVSTGAEPESSDISPYLTEHGLELAFGFQLVPYLAQRGLAKDVSTLGGADAMITPDGIAAVQKLQTARADPREPSRVVAQGDAALA
ncbi:hypothetical protein AB5J62_25110 [Amycolatopsis sp. cg5]|uniref:hypothetical protein n=1 Tax=Amycolatopsis sp. cg5 TaxID=3238802 RepID=UPI0035249711